MFTPAGILSLWKRVNGRFGLAQGDAKGKGSKPSPKAKQAKQEDVRVEKGLTGLRKLGRGDLADPGTAGKFLQSRDKIAKSLKKYCKLLKGNDLKESVQDLGKFRKAVKQLTVAVESLEAKPFPEEVDGEGTDLKALEGVDTSALDKAMEDPNFGEYSEAELDEQEGEAPAVAPDTTPAPPPAPNGAPARFKQRLQQLMPAYQKALQTQAPNRAALEQAMKLAVAAAGKDFAQGLTHLDSLEVELGKVGAPDAPPKNGEAGAEQAQLLARLKKLLPDITRAREEKTPTGQEIRVRYSELTVLLNKKEFGPAAAVLATIANLLKQEGQGPPPDLAAWQAALAKATARLKALAAQVAASKDPETKGALLEINIILNKLIPTPVTAAQVTLMQSFLTGNPVVADLCDLAFDLRTPLLQALAPLGTQLAV